MEPLILIVAAGEGKRLYPLTENIPKPFIDIGDKKLIDLVMEPLPEGLERTVLLKQTEKFIEFEKYLRERYGFGNGNILYQPSWLSLIELPLVLYLGKVSRYADFLRQFDPIILVSGDVIVEGLDYLGMMSFHLRHQADVTMPVKEGIKEGSNSRVWTVKDGRFVDASHHIVKPLGRQLKPDERIYTHQGAFVIGRRIFDINLLKIMAYYAGYHFNLGFRSGFDVMKVIPYEGNFDWIDVRDHQNLAEARRRFG